MSRREDIDNGIWSDPDFETLSLEASMLYFWTWTNPRCGMAGLYKVSERAMTESKVPADKIPAALKELEEARFAYYEGGVLFVRTRVKHLRQKTVQIAKSIWSDLSKVAPEHPLRIAFLNEYGWAPWLDAGRPSPEGQASVTRGSGEGQASSHIEPNNRGSVEGRSTLHGNGNGKGTGKGKGGKGGVGGKPDFTGWAARTLPDLPTEFVASAANMLHGAGQEVTPAAVRERVLVRFPHLGETIVGGSA